MSIFKKFTDFFALFGAFCALVYLIMEFIPYETLEPTSMLGKVKSFLSLDTKIDYRAILVLFVLFLMSFLLSEIFPRLASLQFVVALLPLGWSFFLLDADKLEERPMLYIISALLNAVGAFADCLIADRRDGGRRAVRAASACSILTAVLALLLYLRARSLLELPTEELRFLDRPIGLALEAGASFSPYWRIALMYALITVISILLQNIYFLDFLISLIPGIFVLVYGSARALPAYGASIIVLACFCVLCRLLLTLLANPESVRTPPARGEGATQRLKQIFKKS